MGFNEEVADPASFRVGKGIFTQVGGYDLGNLISKVMVLLEGGQLGVSLNSEISYPDAEPSSIDGEDPDYSSKIAYLYEDLDGDGKNDFKFEGLDSDFYILTGDYKGKEI